MAQRLFFREDPGKLRQRLRQAFHQADRILEAEKELIVILHDLERDRLYRRMGYKSLRGFCTRALKFSKTQSQRLVTLVRRYEPTVPSGVECAFHEQPDSQNQ